MSDGYRQVQISQLFILAAKVECVSVEFFIDSIVCLCISIFSALHTHTIRQAIYTCQIQLNERAHLVTMNR